MKWFALLGPLLFFGVAVAPHSVGEKEELPDLVLDDIYIAMGPGYYPFVSNHYLDADISNIGDAGTDKGFNVSIQMHRLLLGSLPGDLVLEKTVYFDDTIPPGEIIYRTLIYNVKSVSLFVRLYSFTCIINPDKAIIESDYSNNERQEIFVNIFLFIWYPMY
jgi:hypothetical protein